jgi:hypothetical protein
MPRRPARVTQADIARAIRAVEAADIMAVVEVTPEGTIRIIPATHSTELNGNQMPVEPKKEIVL